MTFLSLILLFLLLGFWFLLSKLFLIILFFLQLFLFLLLFSIFVFKFSIFWVYLIFMCSDFIVWTFLSFIEWLNCTLDVIDIIVDGLDGSIMFGDISGQLAYFLCIRYYIWSMFDYFGFIGDNLLWNHCKLSIFIG